MRYKREIYATIQLDAIKRIILESGEYYQSISEGKNFAMRPS